MSYRFKYKDLENLYTYINATTTYKLQILNALERAVHHFGATDCIQGKGADNIKYYYANIYPAIIESLRTLITTHSQNALHFIREFDACELDGDTEVNSETLENIKKSLTQTDSSMSEGHSSSSKTRKGVSHIVDYTEPDYKKIQNIKNKLYKHVEKVESDIFQIDQRNIQKTLSNVEFAAEINALIQTRLTKHRKITSYTNFWSSEDGERFANARERYRDQNEHILIDEFIEEFEKNHPGYALAFDTLFETGKKYGWTEEDIRKIKYIVYDAPEPYRSIYLANLNNIAFNENPLPEDYKAEYYSDENIHLKRSAEYLLDDPRFSTLFHESGHAIDDRTDKISVDGFDTNSYTKFNPKLGKDMTINQAIRYDVFDNKDNPHSITSMGKEIIDQGGTGSNGNLKNVVKAYKNGGYEKLNAKDKALYNAIKNRYQEDTNDSSAFNSVNDIYGGSTKNALTKNSSGERIRTGHDDEYWNDTRKLSRELWAEHYSDHITNNQLASSTTKEFLPTATEMCESYADNIKPEQLVSDELHSNWPKG